MAINYPTSLDNFTNPQPSDTLDSVAAPHATQHSDLNDAVEALEAKVGANSSAVATSLDYKVAQLESDVAGFTSGKILQVVRATDATQRTTTSTSYVDANISVTITPTSATSDILLIWSASVDVQGASGFNVISIGITDSSNNLIEGAEKSQFGPINTDRIVNQLIAIGYDSPATTSATTYKGRFYVSASTTGDLENADNTGQLYAIEVGT